MTLYIYNVWCNCTLSVVRFLINNKFVLYGHEVPLSFVPLAS